MRGAGELRLKESDRIATVVDGLRGLGAEIEATADGFAVTGTGGLRGGRIDAHGDHRLAMLGAVAGVASREGVEVVGMEAAAVSYPGFEADLARAAARQRAARGAHHAEARRPLPYRDELRGTQREGHPARLRRPVPGVDAGRSIHSAAARPSGSSAGRSLAQRPRGPVPRDLASTPMVIAIDGPAGAGKSTVARAVADRLGFTYLDTGAMYRAVALAAEERGEPAAAVAEALEIEVGDRVLVDGRDVTEAIRTPEVSAGASLVAADPAVRAALVRKQQAIMRDGDWVAEGRDIALVVAPDAEVKVFLTAAPEERARRRAAQRGGDPEAVLRAQRERDERDATGPRTVLEPAPDAVPVDTTGLCLDEVVAQIETLAVEAKELT